MEALSLLRYWRSNAGDATTTNANVSITTGKTTTIVTGVSSHASETGHEEQDDNDNGPFFDLEFSLPAEGDIGKTEEHKTNVEDIDIEDSDGSESSDESENENELKLTLISGSSGDSTSDVNVSVSVSPSDDLFFKGSFVPVQLTTEKTSKPPQLRLSLMKSATKFRVMMLKFRKSKLNAESNAPNASTASNASSCSNSKEEEKKEEKTDSGKSMTVKFKGEEVPIVSLFKRHNSSKAAEKPQKENEPVPGSSSEKSAVLFRTQQSPPELVIPKLHHCLRKVKQKYGEKFKLSSSTMEEQKDILQTNPEREKQSSAEVAEPPLLLSNGKGLKQGNLPAGLRVVCKRFGKSWSPSTATAIVSGATPSDRRDDSLLQQQDGIQSAILHCKRSFKSSRDSDSEIAIEPGLPAGKCEGT